MIERAQRLHAIQNGLCRSKGVILVGPRQCGKTTLAREIVHEESVNYFDLEDPLSLARLEEPMLALKDLEGIVVLDEIQLRPNLFPLLRVLLDRRHCPAKFLILGSASGELLRQSAESLAGRLERVELGGLNATEVGTAEAEDLWNRGGLPPSFLAADDQASYGWRKNYVATLLERDMPNMGITIPATTLRRFWTMLAHYHGQTWNAAEHARALGTSEKTTRRYLDLLTDAFLVRQLQPYFANLSKRQVKAPKVYVRDVGILHQLLGIPTMDALMCHPKAGASWEGYAIEQILGSLDYDEAFFWATHQGAEVDLVLRREGRLFGFEIKRADAPKVTRSMHIAMEDLELESLTVVYPGDQEYPLAPGIRASPISKLVRAAQSS